MYPLVSCSKLLKQLSYYVTYTKETAKNFLTAVYHFLHYIASFFSEKNTQMNSSKYFIFDFFYIILISFNLSDVVYFQFCVLLINLFVFLYVFLRFQELLSELRSLLGMKNSLVNIK